MSKFKVWIDDDKVFPGSSGNMMTADVLEADVQRINGFKSGTDVSSQRVNSMIRQNSLVSKALMDISGDNVLDGTSALNNVINVLKKSDNHTVDFTQASSLSNITSGDKLSTSFGKINKQFDSLNTFMKEEENGVKLYASSDTSKGTIEERLTNLGFKEGSLILASGVTATINQIKKQGKVIYFNLVFKFNNTQVTSKIEPGEQTTFVYSIATIPSSFEQCNSTEMFGVTGNVRVILSANNGQCQTQSFSYVEVSGRTIKFKFFLDYFLGTGTAQGICREPEYYTVRGYYLI